MAKKQKKGTAKSRKGIGGRASKYHTHVEPKLSQIAHWKQQGKYEADIAKALGVSIASFESYKHKFPEFKRVLDKGNQYIGHVAERSLYDKLEWQEYVETEEIIEKDANGKDKRRIKRTTKKLPPDTTAIIFALKNKLPNEYSDRRDMNIGGSLEMKSKLDSLSDEELEKLGQELETQYNNTRGSNRTNKEVEGQEPAKG